MMIDSDICMQSRPETLRQRSKQVYLCHQFDETKTLRDFLLGAQVFRSL